MTESVKKCRESFLTREERYHIIYPDTRELVTGKFVKKSMNF